MSRISRIAVAVTCLCLSLSCGGGGGNDGSQPTIPPAVLDLVKQVVDQNGGTLEYKDANSAYNELKITIPAGAMSQSVTITAEIPKNFTRQSSNLLYTPGVYSGLRIIKPRFCVSAFLVYSVTRRPH